MVWLGGPCGVGGALVLGLACGGATGACTFGFLAPLLAFVTLEGRIADGTALVAVFARGHCLPLVLAGLFAGRTGRWLESRAARAGAVWWRRFAGASCWAWGFII